MRTVHTFSQVQGDISAYVWAASVVLSSSIRATHDFIPHMYLCMWYAFQYEVYKLTSLAAGPLPFALSWSSSLLLIAEMWALMIASWKCCIVVFVTALHNILPSFSILSIQYPLVLVYFKQTSFLSFLSDSSSRPLNALMIVDQWFLLRIVGCM